MVLSKSESVDVWERVYKEFNFKPAMNKGVVPFQFNIPYDVYDISKMSLEQLDSMEKVINEIFIECTNEGDKLFALDWQHSNFIFDPRDPNEQKSSFVKDERYLGGGYNAYFPSYYPDGDYYFFIAYDFSYGYLGHPWHQKVWIFGDKLMKAFERSSAIIGFIKVSE